MPAPNPAPPTATRDESYFFETIVFQVAPLRLLVEETLFKVPRHQFERRSEIFASIFTLPTPADTKVEGSDDACPMLLEGVAATDFRRFLKVLYPLDAIPAIPNLSKDEWISVLKLATLWRFLEIRALALTRLDLALQNDCVQQILLGRQYDVVSWLRDGYGALARREEPITLEEARAIGWETALKVFTARETTLAAVYGRPNLYLQRVDAESVFAEEIRATEAAGAGYEMPVKRVHRKKGKNT
ncbi:hypothetical protein MKEN_01420200 [Mycena kentingensis (nom. inval.)]|nr:hypothetical protein MKEN_01420200 [Mycena kentingensis (nom. inval.)]